MTKEDAIKVKHLIDNIHNLDKFLDVFRFEYSTVKTKTQLWGETLLSDNVLKGGLRKEILSNIKAYKTKLEQELDSFIPKAPKFIPGDSIEPTYLKPIRIVSREGDKIEYFKTLRDEFAMKFKWLSNEELEDEIEREETPLECQARLAYSYADAMMKEREK